MRPEKPQGRPGAIRECIAAPGASGEAPGALGGASGAPGVHRSSRGVRGSRGSFQGAAAGPTKVGKWTQGFLGACFLFKNNYF